MGDVGRGRLRVYLGAAPGVGKTFAMLGEGHRRIERGTDIVIGFVECHGRQKTEDLLDGFEVVPRRHIDYRGASFPEMDLDRVLARRPQVALVDELAHTNIPGSRNAKRWQDVEELLESGIDVISTVNVQHLESLNDVVEEITGVRQQETIPDDVVRRADQIELVDMAPPALRRRMAHGNIYPPEKIDAALSNYFREGNLTALRELALLWVADRVDEGLARYRAEHGITDTWEARERVVVALTGGAEGATLIRRAARIAARTTDAQPRATRLMAVHVVRGDGLAGADPAELDRQRALVERLGGTYHQVIGDDVPRALLDFARGVNATQIVLGSSRRSAFQQILGPGVGQTVARGSGDIDVHIVTHEEVGKGRGLIPASADVLGRRRRVAGWVLAVAGPLVLTAALTPFDGGIGLTTDLLLFLIVTVAVGLIGGVWQSVVSAVLGSLLLNFFFTPPLYTLTIAKSENAFALAVFVAVGVAVASVVHLAALRSAQAARARAEASTLSLLATSFVGGERSLLTLLERVRETFGLTSVALLERDASGEKPGWHVLESIGGAPCVNPENADTIVPVTDTLTLALTGQALPADDRRLLGAFASQAAAVVERRRLAHQAMQAKALAEGNRIRTALLAAVSHDLRTPLASIKASVSALRSPDLALDDEDEGELLAGIEESADRLDGLVGNLLDMSRLQTGAVRPLARPFGIDEIIPAALLAVPPEAVRVDAPPDLPPVVADPGLLERALANVVENAVRHTPPGAPPVLVSASAHSGRVELRVADRGPGVPDDAKERIFEPFQRLGDTPTRGWGSPRTKAGGASRTGVGLGLAVARGFVEAVDGTLHADDTPGGGLTMVFSLPAGPLDPGRPAGDTTREAAGG
ncbi:MAG TPA: sensor histidine kinase KdpD [Streptosporangiaceae bacterium]|jgi:two-component system sensor histidine kinase KdpD